MLVPLELQCDLHKLKELHDETDHVDPQLLRDAERRYYEEKERGHLMDGLLHAEAIIEWAGVDLYGSASEDVLQHPADAWSAETSRLLVRTGDAVGVPNTQKCQLKLVRPMEGGRGGFCQVWQVQLQVISATGEVVPGEHLVLKLYDTNHMPEPSSVAWLPWQPTSFGEGLATSRCYAANEAEAYKRLRDLQDGRLPKSYGHYTFSLPHNFSGKQIPGMVMEYLGAEAIEIDLRKRSFSGAGDPSAHLSYCMEQLKDVFEVETLFRKKGVFHMGVDQTSVLLHENKWKFVGFCRSRDGWDKAMDSYCTGVNLGLIVNESGLGRNESVWKWVNQVMMDSFPEEDSESNAGTIDAPGQIDDQDNTAGWSVIL